MSKFAHMAMKELEELREAVREKGSSKMDKAARVGVAKTKGSTSRSEKEVTSEKKKPMGGGFGQLRKTSNSDRNKSTHRIARICSSSSFRYFKQ